VKHEAQEIQRIAVLISGRGSNLQALLDATREGRLRAELRVVISNNVEAPGLERARKFNVETIVLDHRDKSRFPSREDYDQALVEELRKRDVDVVCLAGFMRLLSPVFINAFPNAVLNIHPSLLPSFPGVNAQYQAWEHGVKQTGVTVHLVTAELDGGPILLQEAVPIQDDDDVEALSARILAQEHKLYPEAVRILLEGGWRVEGRRFIRRDPGALLNRP
jgi:phosphoribosylglycinamide formyltransferase-1